MSPSEDAKFSNVRGLYLRKYGIYYLNFLTTEHECYPVNFTVTNRQLGLIKQWLLLLKVPLYSNLNGVHESG